MTQFGVLWKYLRRYQWMYILGLCFVILSNIASVMIPPYVRNATDNIVKLVSNNSRDQYQLQHQILYFIGLVLGVALLKGVFMFFMRQTLVVNSRRLENDMRNDMMRFALFQNAGFYKKFPVGDIMNRMSEDLSQVRTFMGPVILYFVNTVSLVFLVIFMMFRVDWQMSLWILLPLPFLTLAIFLINSGIYKRSKEIQQSLSSMTVSSNEAFNSILMIKSLNAENWILNSFKSESHYNRVRVLDLAKLQAWYFPLIQFFVSASILLAIYFGAIRVGTGQISLGNIAEFVLYINMIMFPISSLGWVFSVKEQASASLHRIAELMNYDSQRKGAVQVKFQDSIRFENVSLVYNDTGTLAIDHVNLKLTKGRKYLLIGKIASGKSSLISLLLGVNNPTSGTIFLNDTDLSYVDLPFYRRQVALVSQETILFSDTIENNIKFYNKSISEDRYREVIRLCQLEEEIKSFKNGDQTRIGERGVLLSGGQKQRIALARALVDPQMEFLILDDPFSAVDIQNEIGIWNNIAPWMENKTLLMVSHRVTDAIQFDEIVQLSHGQITHQGDKKQMIENSKYYRKIQI